MSTTAQLPDGTTLEFPDGTPPEQIQAAIQQAMASAAHHASADPGILSASPPGLAALDQQDQERQAKRQQLADIGAHGDVGHEDIPDPGYGQMALDSFGNTVGRYMLGAMQRTYGDAPQLQQASDDIAQRYARDRVDFHAAAPGGELGGVRGAYDAALELGNQSALGAAIPIPAGAFGASAVESSLAGRLASSAAHGAVGGGMVGYATSAGKPAEEQLKETLEQGALGAGFGLLGGARQIDATAREAPPAEPTPEPLPEPVPAAPKLPPDVSQKILGDYQAEKAQAPDPVQVEQQWHPVLKAAGFRGDESLAAEADQAQASVAPEVAAPALRPLAALREMWGPQVPEHPQEAAFRQYAESQGYTPESLPEDLFHRFYSAEPEPPVEGRTYGGDVPPPGYELGVFGKQFTIPDPIAAIRQRFGMAAREPINAEAGFLGLGKRSPPPPADPFEALVRHNDAPNSSTALDTLRTGADRMIDDFFDREAPIGRRMRRAGLNDAADYVERLQSRARGASGMVAPGRGAGPIEEGTYVFDPALQGSRRTGDGLKAILGGADAQTAKDLNDFMAAQHHLELVHRQQQAVDNFQHEFLLQGLGVIPADPPVQPHPDVDLNVDSAATALVHAKLSELAGRYGTGPHGQMNSLSDLAGEVTALPNGHFAATGIRDWAIRSRLMPLRAAGRLGPEEFDFHPQPNGTYEYSGRILGKNGYYAPFARLVDIIGEDPEVLGSSTKGNPIQQISGGLSEALPVAPPLETFVQDAQKATMWAERQQVRNEFARWVDQTPELQEEIRKIPAGTGPSGLPIQVRGSFDVWRDGVKSQYAAPPDVTGAFERLMPKQLNILWESLRTAARFQKAAAIFTPEFAFRNFSRLQMTAGGMGAEYNYRPFLDPVLGMFDMAMGDKGKNWTREWRANGGAVGGGISYGRPEIQAALGDALAGPGMAERIGRRFRAESLIGKIAFPALAPLEALTETLHEAPAAGGYRRARMKGATPLEATRYAREIMGGDLGRGGRLAQELNAYYPFLNAELQHSYGFTQALKRRPAATVLKALTYITIPAVINWYKWHNDEDYKALPEWEKASFMHLGKTNDPKNPFTAAASAVGLNQTAAPHWWRIPRPLGLMNLGFSYGAEAFLNYVAERDPEAAHAAAAAIVSETPLHYLPWTPVSGFDSSALPGGLRPIVDLAANKSRITRGPIIPPSVQGELPAEQANDNTSGIARKVGGAVGAAPLAIDYLLQGYGGSYARSAAQLTGSTQPKQPIGAADVPLVRGFVSTSSTGFGSDPVTKLYQLSQKAAQAKQSQRSALDSGDVLRYQQILKDNPEVHLNDFLLGIREELKPYRDLRNEIFTRAKGEGRSRLTQAEAEEVAMIDQAVTQRAATAMHGAAYFLQGER